MKETDHRQDNNKTKQSKHNRLGKDKDKDKDKEDKHKKRHTQQTG